MPFSDTSKTVAVQNKMVSYLTADSFFSGANPVPVIAEIKGDITNELQQAVQKVGIGVVIREPYGDFNGEAARISLLLNFLVGVTENVTVNRASTGSQKSAWMVAEKILALLQWKPNGTAGNRSSSRAQLFHVDTKALTPLGPDPGRTYKGIALKITTSIFLP